MTHSNENDLDLQHLRKAFGSLRALDDVTFTVKAGEIFGFVGSNGAGKTTTMRSILGVLEPDAGRVLVGGEPITAEIRRTIGYMPEERGLYPKMKIGEQLIYLARLHGISSSDATTLMQTWTERLGIDGRRNDTVDSLSLGNQQRVQLAAALIHRPRILILDEPFSGLDPIAVDVMSGVLREIADTGVPVLFSSHQLPLVEDLSDHVGIIKAGRIIANGTVDELRGAAPRRYAITTSGLADGWLEAVPGVTVESVEPGRIIVNTGDVEASRVLAAAVAAGSVSEFTAVRARLTELYKEAVAA